MKRLVLLGIVCAAVATVRAAPDPLSTAKDLYAAAAYEDALRTLAQVDDGSGADVARQVAEYRTFCLYALGRLDEAESTAEMLIRTNPLMVLDASEASPRIAEMFVQVRKRLLPTLIREAYRSARVVGTQPSAETAVQLTQVRMMLDDAQKLGVWDETLADLRVLVDGFLDLSTADSRRAAAPTAPPPSLPIDTPAAVSASAPSPLTPARIYSRDDQEVIAPTKISQMTQLMSSQLARLLKSDPQSRLVQITIGENGVVQDAVFLTGDHSYRDNFLIWQTFGQLRYRPATRSGVPVKYRETIQLSPDTN